MSFAKPSKAKSLNLSSGRHMQADFLLPLKHSNHIKI
nr:MAG TPA: hypothetical protein [Inoviridae sp.]